MLWCYSAAARDIATLQRCGAVVHGNDRRQRTLQRWRTALKLTATTTLRSDGR